MSYFLLAVYTIKLMNTHKSKLLFCFFSTFLPSSGLHWLYLKGTRCPWFYIHLLCLALGMWGFITIDLNKTNSVLAWIAVAIGLVGILASWMTSLVYGLRPDDRWDAQFNTHSQQKSESGWLVVGCVVFSLMLGAFDLMASVTITLEQVFISQVEAARQLSQ